MDKRLHSRKTEFLLIALLFSLAVAQPLYDLLGEQAEFFVTHGIGRGSLVAFTFILSLLLPLAFASIPLLAGRLQPRLGTICQYAFQFLFWLLIFLPIASRAELAGITAIAACGIAAATCMTVYASFYPVRLMLYYLTPAILLFPLFFLFSSKVTEIVLPRQGEVISAQSTPALETNVVFIVLDEIPLASLLSPALEIDRLRYPNFARLADTSAWFRGATTPSEITTGAVSVALSGTDIESVHGLLPIHSNFPRSLFTLLGSSHDVTAFETSTLLCPETVCQQGKQTGSAAHRLKAFSSDLSIIYAHLIVPRPYSTKLPSISHAWSGFAAESSSPGMSRITDPDLDSKNAYAKIKQQENWRDRAEEFQQFIDAIKQADQPQFYYLHSLLPHSAWRYLPDGKKYVFNEDRVNFGIRPDDDPQRVYFHEWYGDAHAVNQSWQRHILQVQFVDSLIGRLLDKLEQENLLDNSLLVVIGDHGASFIPGQSRRDANNKTLSDITAVPLFIKFPQQERGSVTDFHATLADILPTIVDALEVETDWQFYGSNLVGNPPRKDDGTVRILKSNGDPFSYEFPLHLDNLRKRATQAARTFGSGEESRLFNFGPHPSLAGKNLDSLTIGRPGNGQLVLEGADLFHDVNIDAGFVPRQIWGRWDGMEHDQIPRHLAIAVNGIISVTTQTYDIAGFQDSFSAMLPADSLSPGDNRVQVFSIESGPDRLVLREINPAENAPMRLISSKQGEALVRSDDEEFTVKSIPWPGEVETRVDHANSQVYLQGSIETEPGEEVVLVVIRNGMSTHSKPISAQSHFRIPIDFTDESSAGATKLRVLIVDDKNGVARELGYPPLCSPRWIFAPPASWKHDDCNRLPASLPNSGGGTYRAVLNFGQESIRQYMGDGWNVHKSSLSWTVGKRARLSLPLPHLSGQWTFQATLKPFLAPGRLQKQRLILSVNGEASGEWELSVADFASIEWQIPGNMTKDNAALELEFTMPDSDSPQAMGVSKDQRQLGFAFSRLVITGNPEK